MGYNRTGIELCKISKGEPMNYQPEEEPYVIKDQYEAYYDLPLEIKPELREDYDYEHGTD